MINRLSINDASDRGECLAVRRTLDLARPGEPESAALAEANRHVQTCPECQAVVRRHQQWDASLGAVCRDVPVPADLAARIVLALETAAEPAPANATATAVVSLTPTTHHSPLTTHAPTAPAGTAPLVSRAKQPHLLRRRRAVWFAAAAVCTLLAGGSWYVLFRPTIDLDALITRVADDDRAADRFPIFPEGSAPPPSGTLNGRIVFDVPRQLPEQRTAAEQKVAVYFFTLPATRSDKAVHGKLLVVPVAKVISPPGPASFLGRPAVYPGRNLCASVWVEGDFAYVCLVKGGDDSLQLLQSPRPVAI